MSKFILLVVCAMAMVATTHATCDTDMTKSMACTLAKTKAGESTCVQYQNSFGCYSALCCKDPAYKGGFDAANATTGIPGTPLANCVIKCGAGAMATPTAALFAVVMSMLYRLM